MVRKKDLRGGGGHGEKRHGENEIKEKETIKHTHSPTQSLHTLAHMMVQHSFLFLPVRVCPCAYIVFLSGGGLDLRDAAARL